VKWFSSLESSGWLDIIRSAYIENILDSLCDLLVLEFDTFNRLYVMSSTGNVSTKQ